MYRYVQEGQAVRGHDTTGQRLPQRGLERGGSEL